MLIMIAAVARKQGKSSTAWLKSHPVENASLHFSKWTPFQVLEGPILGPNSGGSDSF